MDSLYHVMIMGNGIYPTFDDQGNENGEIECWAFDRCWCVVEAVVRDRIAVKQLGLNKSEIIILDDVIEKIASGGQSSKLISEAIAHCFRDTDFFGNLKGKPEDVNGVKELLLSEGFFRSPAEFNEHFRRMMVRLFTENIPQVGTPCLSSVTEPAGAIEDWIRQTNFDHCDSFCGSRRIHWTRSC